MSAESHHSIEIAKGLGEIKFGTTTGDVQQYLGRPDETEILDPKTESTVMWYYTGERLQIIFQKSSTDEAARVNQLCTSHPAATLWGRRIIGCPESEVVALFKTHGHEGFMTMSETVGEHRYKSLRMERTRVTLGFCDGLLQRLLWGKVET